MAPGSSRPARPCRCRCRIPGPGTAARRSPLPSSPLPSGLASLRCRPGNRGRAEETDPRARSNNEQPLEDRLPASGSLTASTAPNNNDVAGGTSCNFHASTASREAIRGPHLVSHWRHGFPSSDGRGRGSRVTAPHVDPSGRSGGAGFGSDARRVTLSGRLTANAECAGDCRPVGAGASKSLHLLVYRPRGSFR